MMACHRKSGIGLPDFLTLHCPGGGMIHFRAAAQPSLKGIRIFPNVVGQSGQPPLLLGAKGGGEMSTELCSAGQMSENCLLSTVF